jgi:hypothetical protein
MCEKREAQEKRKGIEGDESRAIKEVAIDLFVTSYTRSKMKLNITLP